MKHSEHTSKTWQELLKQMQAQGMPVPANRLRIQIPDAENVLRSGLTFFLKGQGRALQWLPEYDEVANWLSDNGGRGLFLYGNCGRGKSLLGRFVLPAILLHSCRLVSSIYDMRQMNGMPDEVLRKRILSLDDVGTEEVLNVYGNRRLVFAEVMDAAEKEGKLLIVSSNLDADQLRQRYGDRTLDRIRACMHRLPFRGESLRE